MRAHATSLALFVAGCAGGAGGGEDASTGQLTGPVGDATGDSGALQRDAARDSGAARRDADRDPDPRGRADAAVDGARGDGPDACRPWACESVGAACGDVADGCGATLRCGDCPGGAPCGPDHRCGCLARVCEPDDCGPVPDGCGGSDDCGACANTSALCDPTSHRCVCAPASCTGRCGPVADACGNPTDCGGCPDGAACDAAVGVCAPAGLDCSGRPETGECEFGVNPCRWSCNPIFNQTDHVFIPACCQELARSGDPFACCFDARRVCTPEQCAAIPEGVMRQRCAQMWEVGCCPEDSPDCPL